MVGRAAGVFVALALSVLSMLGASPSSAASSHDAPTPAAPVAPAPAGAAEFTDATAPAALPPDVPPHEVLPREAVETEFVVRINELRGQKGLEPLAVDPALTTVAREWATGMASAGRISHRTDLTVVGTHPDWVTVGENVGVGPTVISLHDAFVASPKHLENLVDPDWQYVGIGVVFAGDVIYVAQNFMEIARAN